MRLKRAAIGILVLLALFPGSCIMNAKIPEYRAKRICAPVELGATFSTVEEIVRRDGPPVREFGSYSDYTHIKPDYIVVVYWEWMSPSRWICDIRFANGKVAEKEVSGKD